MLNFALLPHMRVTVIPKALSTSRSHLVMNKDRSCCTAPATSGGGCLYRSSIRGNAPPGARAVHVYSWGDAHTTSSCTASYRSTYVEALHACGATDVGVSV